MFKKTLALLAVMAAGCTLFANVDLRTNIRDIYYRGTCEEAGSITMSVNGDDFSEASTAQPVFIRVRLDQGATLCQTLVNNDNKAPNNADRTFNVPIYLAMRIESSLSANVVSMAAPAETVSIVRWKKGEGEIWLRVINPTDQWLSVSGAIQAPDNQIRVAWTFGTTARNSHLTYDKAGDSDYIAGLANLPFNTRNFAPFADANNLAADVDTRTERTAYAQSTLVCINVEDATFLEPAPAANSLVKFDTISFIWNEAIDPEGPLGAGQSGHNPAAEEHDGNVRTANVPSAIIPAPQASANFSGDDSIARGNDISCGIAIDKEGGVSPSLCFSVDQDQQGNTSFGLVCTSNTMQVQILGCYGWNTSSDIVLVTGAGADYGFRVAKDADGDIIELVPGIALLHSGSYLNLGEVQSNGSVSPMSTFAYAPTSALFSAAGEANALSAVAIVVYNDLPSISTANPTLQLGVTVCMDPTSDPQDIVISGAVEVTNKDTARDEAPYDGLGDSNFSFDIVNETGFGSYNVSASDQNQFCPPIATTIGTFTWDYGVFRECTASTRIFYPYLPAVAGNPTFWSGISFVNHGWSDLDYVTGYVYEADGSAWAVEFPGLAMRNQQTWLLQDNNGVAFTDTEQVLDPIAPQSLGNDIVPMNQRSSMFVVGTAVGDTFSDVAAPDIDGFCLIGNTETKVIYGYLPRNVERVLSYTDADLPARFAKEGESKDKFNAEVLRYTEMSLDLEMDASPYKK